MAAKQQLVGPPEPRSKYDNLPIEPEPMEEGKTSLVKALLPLILAQGVDLLTTERLMGQPPDHTGSRPFEGNPLPGMQSTAGRLGWGALETALAGLLMKKAPKLGARVRNSLVGVHSGLAMGNEHQARMFEDRRSAVNRADAMRK